MELIGESNNRKIFYLNVQKDITWFEELPMTSWVVFVICDNLDVSFISDKVSKCMDKDVGYVCCAGKACEIIHDIFDEEIVARAQGIEAQSGKEWDYENSPMTVWDKNFGNGFWFAITNTYDGDKEFDKIVCIDCTTKGVRKHLKNLIEKINASWIPSDEEIEEPEYDK